ncbi:hypothetical protein [Chitinophaga cymbidii]|uniref:Outer membrane protein beta-barrel domain-containing protein n=1 Tax=Chitinophaga cymbidii TaxID=1096750 RepID=A0A512RF99_9BACT|nr:hypothetical protein [Chitinophaga cymbidii]GEP94318.1 hypothetical protein CCY01nite_05780 [Chitinophaga cymbidii]
MKICYLQLLLLLICLTGCYSPIYLPNQVNAPLLKEKNEWKINVAPSNWQAAYAVTDHFAVMLNGMYSWERFGTHTASNDSGLFDHDSPFTRPEGGFAEVGAGYFTTIVDHPERPLIFDVFAGYGAGGFTVIDRSYYVERNIALRKDHTVRTTFHKFFIQPGIGMRHERVELSFNPRFTLLTGYNSRAGILVDNYRDYLNRGLGKTVWLYEPALTLRLGSPHIKWHFQIHGSVPMNGVMGPDKFLSPKFFPEITVNSGITLNFRSKKERAAL